MLVDGGQRVVTFAELASQVERLSDVLRRERIGPGAVVAVSLSDGAAGLVALLAVAAAGGVPAPFAAGWWPREARAAAEDLAPDLVIADSTTSAALRDCAPQLLVGAGLEGLAHPESIDRLGDRLDRRVELSDTAVLLAPTAGVWGRPRTLEALPPQLATWADATQATSGLTVIASDLALVSALQVAVAALGNGGSVAFPGVMPRSVDRLLNHLGERASGVDLLWTTGAIANRFAQHVRSQPNPLRAPVSYLEIGQGPLWPGAGQLLGDQFGAAHSCSYTLTEAGGFVTRRKPRDGGTDRPLDVGSPVAGITVAVSSDTDDGFGALTVSGSLLGGSAQTETGDRGRWRENRLELAGRTEDCFLTDELPVWPVQVEEALSHHPDVADLAVARRPHPERGEVGVLVVVPKDPERPPFLDDFAPFMENLAPHARPLAQAVVDQLPLTAFGQVHRRMLGYDEASR